MLPYLQLRFSAPYFSPSCASNNFLCPPFNCVVVIVHCQQNKVRWSHHISASRYWSHSFATFSSITRSHSLGALQMSIGTDETSDVGQSKSTVNMEQILSNYVQAINTIDSSKSPSFEDYKERQRREKIGLANKGRVPWNKGKKHSTETRERIKQRTIEAMQNPKVRKKMSECPRSRSDHVKKKIGFSLRRLWGKRLKWKRSKEDFFRSWSESIAEAAKVGGSEEQVLGWDSYNKTKQDLELQQLQLAAEKEMAKEIRKIVRAEKRLQRRLKKMDRLASRKGHEKAKDQQHMAKVNIDEDNSIVLEEFSLKQRLRKLLKHLKPDSPTNIVILDQKLLEEYKQIREKEVSINGEVTRKGVPVMTLVTALEKLDIELIKRERRQGQVSLADEIRAAKNKKSATREMEASSNVHPSF